MRTYCIYTLSRDAVPFYVGVTINMGKRHSSHRSAYQDDGITIELLEEVVCEKEEALLHENYWINQLDAWGFTLNNGTGLAWKNVPVDRETTTAAVRVSKEVYLAVKDHCKKNGIIIGGFFEVAAKDRLKRAILSKSTNHE